MRRFQEPTARNLLRKPLVLGVPLFGLIFLSFLVLGINLIGGTNRASNISALIASAVGYVALRVLNRFSKNGWDEVFIFRLERMFTSTKLELPPGEVIDSFIEVSSHDTLDETQLVQSKERLYDWLRSIHAGESLSLLGIKSQGGVRLVEVREPGTQCVPPRFKFAYSLHQLPVVTDPLWLAGILDQISCDFVIAVRFIGLDFWKTKSRIENARRSNSGGNEAISDIDSDVSFEEASQVLQGISRGDERIYEASLIVFTEQVINIDPDLFCIEKDLSLAAQSIVGLRKRPFRSFLVRECTASDLIPNLQDPLENSSPILRTKRGLPLYFSPLDPRLQALHWIVFGATGSGKSVFSGLVLKRLLEAGEKISVFIIDHDRSFRRLVRNQNGPYLEPVSSSDIERSIVPSLEHLNSPGRLSGIELSDIPLGQKKEAIKTVLSQIYTFMRKRESSHVIYIVLDECANWMKLEPELVESAFREYRKLNGAVIAIAQSLFSFLTEQTGQSICQNAPIRILLRQDEDLNLYKGILGLNAREVDLVKGLQQRKGVYNECLIKTPFLSRIGRLYPTEFEYAELRTDNLREELVQNIKDQRVREAECAIISHC